MSERRSGTLYLIPVALGGADAHSVLAPATVESARGLRTFIAENAKSARGFLKAIGHPGPLQNIQIHLLDEHSGARDIEALLALLTAGRDCGLVSEAGCPAVADPGAALVRRAHEAGVRVIPLIGPSSILLALMASGLNGQNFAFNGYLPVEKAERERRLKELDRQAQGETQIFIETPYRNVAMLQALAEHCRGDTLLCLAVDLTMADGFVATRTIAEWKRKPPVLDRRQVVFLIFRPDRGPK
ncbi:MAG TPA: SAM-dependent methyltransferase [Burkholderiales bacterium]|nr:SAM-dependent methyltransferase [Burkholderiales bacterium]